MGARVPHMVRDNDSSSYPRRLHVPSLAGAILSLVDLLCDRQ